MFHSPKNYLSGCFISMTKIGQTKLMCVNTSVSCMLHLSHNAIANFVKITDTNERFNIDRQNSQTGCKVYIVAY